MTLIKDRTVCAQTEICTSFPLLILTEGLMCTEHAWGRYRSEKEVAVP